jgi:hypothetical protein
MPSTTTTTHFLCGFKGAAVQAVATASAAIRKICADNEAFRNAAQKAKHIIFGVFNYAKSIMHIAYRNIHEYWPVFVSVASLPPPMSRASCGCPTNHGCKKKNNATSMIGWRRWRSNSIMDRATLNKRSAVFDVGTTKL